MAGRRAFSLIELLVVLAIISTLVGVSLPMVRRFRQQADMLECQFRLRTLATSLVAYATDAGGSLPPGPIEVHLAGSVWQNDPDRGSPLGLFNADRIGEADLSSQQGWYGQGLVWKAGYIENGHPYYCPEADRRMDWGYDQLWPQRTNDNRMPTDGKSQVWSSYAYRGGLSSQAGTPNGPLNLYRNPGTLAVLADSPCFGSMWHEGGYNVAFLDTRVEFCPFDQPIVPDEHIQGLWQAIDAFWE